MGLPFGQQNIRLVSLILITAVCLAHLDTDVQRDAAVGINGGAELRHKRLTKTLGAKLGQLGRYFHHFAKEREAKKTLLADAKLESTAITREVNIASYRKAGGCTRAMRDFKLMETAGTKVLNRMNFVGKVGDKPVTFNGDYTYKKFGQKIHGCEIRMGLKRESGGTIAVFYPEKAKFRGFDK